MTSDRGKIAIFCSAKTRQGEAAYEEAQLLGRLLAQAGFTVCSGGYQGSMEAVSRGAREAGGRTIGVTLAQFDPRPANPWVAKEIKMPTYLSRIERLITLADGYIALPGGMGTLTEMAATWSLLQLQVIPARPAILLGEGWARVLEAMRRELVIPEADFARWQLAASANEAAELLAAAIPQTRKKQ
jgi:hypothetical protein